MKLIFILLTFLSINILAQAKTTDSTKKGSIQFFTNKNNKKINSYKYNPYENIISGAAAFVIGNVGYIVADSPVLKLSYTGIQTIGIINIGRGIYKYNSPSIEKSFHKMMTDKKINVYSKSKLADNLLSIFAREERAKRLALFYSSSLLSFQYFLNALVFDSPEKLETTYLFLGGVNLIVSAYSALYKSDYEEHFFGKNLDLSPFLVRTKKVKAAGLRVSYSF